MSEADSDVSSAGDVSKTDFEVASRTRCLASALVEAEGKKGPMLPLVACVGTLPFLLLSTDATSRKMLR